ncbi:hypothetical protein HYV86_06440 [Candidatus Woesearchaeota archaeon]|nr:hypothetical protein [Candidatus Woesearchaeota archaeon]
MSNSSTWLALYGVLGALLLIGTALLVRLSSTNFFVLQVLLLLVAVIIFTVGFITFAQGKGRMFFFIGFLLFIVLEIVLLIAGRGVQNVVPFLIVALIGFFLSMPPRHRSIKVTSSEPHSMVFDAPMPKPVEEVKTTVVKPIAAKTVVKVEHSPGKYLASKQSNQYHEPKCEWATKISSKRRVWFQDKEEAWEKGYKAHTCVDLK